MPWNPNFTPNRGQNNYQNDNSQRPQNAKRTGATYSNISKGNFTGMMCCNAWKSTKNGLITCSVMPYHKSDEVVTNSKGVEYIKMIARINYPSGNEKVLPCLMNTQTKVIGLTELGWCISPKGSGQTAKGKHVTGYFGSYTRK